MSSHFILPATVRRSHPGRHGGPVNDRIPAPGVEDISQTGL